MHKSLILFCEGAGPSHDIAVLERVVKRWAPATSVIAAGSKNGLGAYARGHIRDRKISYLCFRDRDFDALPTADGGLIPTKSQNKFMTQRGCIENYLLNPKLMAQYLSIHLKGRFQKTYPELNEQDFEKRIEAAAKAIRSYQAARWTLADARRFNAKLPSSWLERDDMIPPEGMDCLAPLEKTLASVKSKHEHLKNYDLKSIYHGYVEKFKAADFYEMKQYHYWFHGKNLVKALVNKLPMKTPPSFLEGYLKWAQNEINLMDFPDLVQLGTILANNAG